MYGTLTQIKELCIEVGRNISGIGRIILHLFIATLYSIGTSLRCIFEICWIKNDGKNGLADRQKYTYALAVVVTYGILQYLVREVAVATGLIGQTLPTNTRIMGLTIALNAKYRRCHH